MRTAIEAVLEYLVLKQLAGKTSIVRAILMYYVDNVNVAEIARTLGMPKNIVRGYIQRIVEKAGSPTRARAIMKYVAPHVTRIKPVMIQLGENHVKCLLCGDVISIHTTEYHLKHIHTSFVEDKILEIIEEIRKELRTRRTTTNTLPN